MSTLKKSLLKIYLEKKDLPKKPEYWDTLVNFLKLEGLIHDEKK